MASQRLVTLMRKMIIRLIAENFLKPGDTKVHINMSNFQVSISDEKKFSFTKTFVFILCKHFH